MVVKKETVTGYTRLPARQVTKVDVDRLIAQIGDGSTSQAFNLEWKSGHVAPPGNSFAALDEIDEFDDLSELRLTARYGSREDSLSVNVRRGSASLVWKGYTAQDRAGRVERWWRSSPGHARFSEPLSLALRPMLIGLPLLVAYLLLSTIDVNPWTIALSGVCLALSVSSIFLGGRYFVADRARRQQFITEQPRRWWREPVIVVPTLAAIVGAGLGPVITKLLSG